MKTAFAPKFLQFLLLPLFVFVLNVGWGQTTNGYLDFGTTADGTTATAVNTGFDGLRVGTGGGGFTIQNAGTGIGAAGEIRGIAPTSGSVNSVGVSSAIYGTAATTFTISFELNLSGGASGTWYFFAGNGTTTFGTAQSATFTGNQVFTGIQWIFGASSAITTNNRAVSTWTAVSGTPFAQSTNYYVTIVGNNSASSVSYGEASAYSVAVGTYDLWINGVLAGNDLGKAQLPAATTINAFRFYGESSTSNVATIALDNIRWYNSCVLPPTHLTLVSVPSTGTTATNLATYTSVAKSGSTTGPTANSFTGAITIAKVSGTGTISGTLAPSAVAGTASYANTQFSAADTYTINASAESPIVNAATSGNIVISSASPTISASGSLSATNTTYGTASASPTSFNVSGANMSAGILVTPPAGYEVCLTSNGTYTSTVTVGTSGTIASTTVYVRLAAATAVGSYSGNIVLSSTSATSVNVATVSSTVSAKALTITGLTGSNKTYDGLTTASTTGNATYSGLVNGQSFSVTGTPSFSFATASVGTAKPITVIGYTAPSSNYSITQPTGLTGNITAAPLTITGLTGANKTYDGLTSASATGTAVLSGVIGSDVVTLGGTPVYNFSSASVGTAISITTTGYSISGAQSSNYSLTQPTLSATIAARALTITANGASKTYGQIISVGSGSTAFSSSGLQNGETIGSVTITANGGTAANAAVGSYSLTPSVATGSSFSAGNYSISYTNGTLSVTPATLTITANDVTKTLGATLTGGAGSTAFTSSGLQNSETIGSVTINYGTASSADAVAGVYLQQVTPSAATEGTFVGSNYSINYVAGNITVTSSPAIAGAATANPFSTIYGSASAAQTFTISGSALTADITATAPTGFEVSAGGTSYGSTATFIQTGGSVNATLYIRIAATTTPGTYNTLNIVLSSTGATSLNISTSSTGNTVSQKALTITGATTANKIYDGTNTASVIGGTLVGIVGSDNVTLTQTGTFAQTAVGSSIAITSTSTIVGTNASNYTLTQPSLTSRDITVKALTVTGANTVNKVYDGSNTATITGGTLVGIVGSDNVTLTQTGTFAQATVGTNITITSTSSLSGTSASNYSLSQPTLTSRDITAKALTIASPVASSKVYDGTTSASITGTLSGVVSPDVVTLSGTGTFASSNVGTGISVTSTSTIGGANAGNYTLTQPAGLSANITTKSLTLNGISVSNKVYDGTTTAILSGTASYVGLMNGETFSVTGTPSATFNNKNVGTSKPISVSGYTAPSVNYSITQPTGLTADITAKALAVTLPAVTTKTYDGNTNAIIIGTLSGIISPDAVTLAGTGTFASANAGSGISVSSTSTLGGLDAGNYTLTQPMGLSGNITQATQTITFNALANQTTANTVDYSPGAESTTSGVNAITYTSSNTAVATIVSGFIHIVGAGSTTITASQAASTNYNAASDISQILIVSPSLLIEDFNYPNSALLTSNNWIAHSGAGTNAIATSASSITYSGYLSSNIGNEISLMNTGEDVNRPFSSVNTGSFYASFIVNVSAASTTGDYFAHFAATSGSSNVTSFGGRIWVKKDANGNLAFGISKGSTAANINYTSNVYSMGVSYLLVVKYNFISGTSNDNADLFINPSLNNIAPAANISTSTADNASADPIELKSFCLRQGTSTTAPLLKLDGIRVSLFWGDVVGRANPTLSIANPNQTYSSSAISATVTGSVAGTVSNVKYNGSATVPTAPGTYAVTANFVPTDGNNYNSITNSSAGDFVISKATLTITATNQSKCQGTTLALGSSQFTSSGLLGSDAVSSVTLTSSGSGSGSAAGSYSILPSAASGSGLSNYNITYTNGSLTVNTLPAAPTASNATRCGTGTVVLSATVPAGITIDWYSAATGGTLLLSGNSSYTTASISSTTTYYAEARNTTSGCVSSSRAAVTATVNPTPAITAMTASICSGESFTTVPANGTNGTVPTATTYAWTLPTGTGIQGLIESSAANSISGTLFNTTNAAIDAVYTVTPTAESCSGTPFTVTVTVNALPYILVSSDNSAICAGNSASLTAGMYSALGPNVTINTSSYVWSSGATTSVASVSPSTTTYYTVIGTNTSTGCTNTGGVLVTVNAAPTALTITGTNCLPTPSSPGTVSSSSSVSGVSYQLTHPQSGDVGSPITGNGSGLLWTAVPAIPTVQGFYTVVATNALGCTTESNGVYVYSSAGNTPYSYYADVDGDLYSSSIPTSFCQNTPPLGYSATSGGDCNDNNAAIRPGATEICGDGIDNDCSGADSFASMYRSNASGDWSTASTWVSSCDNGLNYNPAPLAPTGDNYSATNPFLIEVRSQDAVTVSTTSTTNCGKAGSLTINSGGTVIVNGKLTVVNAFVNNGTLTINNGGSFVQNSTTTANSGNGTYNVNMTLAGSNNGTAATGRYWFIGSPMNNTVAGTFYEPTNLARLWQYNASNNSWPSVVSTTLSSNNALKLVPGIGYLYRAGAERTFTFTGGTSNFNNNIITSLLPASAATGYLPVTGYNNSIGFKFVSNPYPSHVDWHLVTRTGLNVSYWIRTADNTNYESYNLSSGLSTNNISGQTTRFIPPMQGFYVYAFNTTPTLRIDNTDRVHSGNVLHTPEFNQVVRLNLNDGKTADQAVVYENENATNGLEDYDTYKMFDTQHHQLYIMEGIKELSMDGLKDATAKQKVDMGIQITAAGTYTINATELGVEEDVMLEDKFTHTFQDMKLNNTYSFTANAGTFNNRFVLHFTLNPQAETVIETETVGVTETEVEGVSVYTTTIGQQVKVWVTNTADFQNATVKVYDAIGNMIERKNMTSSELLLELDIASGIYVVEVTGANKTFTKKVFITK